MMKHYGNFLPWAGRPVQYKADEIAALLSQKKQLEEKLELLKEQIAEAEIEFLAFIRDEWTADEIKEAQTKEFNYNNKKRTL